MSQIGKLYEEIRGAFENSLTIYYDFRALSLSVQGSRKSNEFTNAPQVCLDKNAPVTKAERLGCQEQRILHIHLDFEATMLCCDAINKFNPLF